MQLYILVYFGSMICSSQRRCHEIIYWKSRRRRNENREIVLMCLYTFRKSFSVFEYDPWFFPIGTLKKDIWTIRHVQDSMIYLNSPQ